MILLLIILSLVIVVVFMISNIKGRSSDRYKRLVSKKQEAKIEVKRLAVNLLLLKSK